jgi:hypothetical protein
LEKALARGKTTKNTLGIKARIGLDLRFEAHGSKDLTVSTELVNING